MYVSRQELQDLQCLYKQSVEHAGEQAQLIQQLEGLNLDTQRVLCSQEEAHAADAVSYQKVQVTFPDDLGVCPHKSRWNPRRCEPVF